MDTTIEHEDNYRFLNDMERRWQDVYGLGGIEILREGRSPYEVADDHHIVANQRTAPCTKELKIWPFMEWLKRQSFQPVIHIGIDYSEVHRKKAILRNYTKAGYEVDFPLLWKPIEHRSYSLVCREDWGIKPPVTYAMGFSHANCLGQDEQGRGGCVKFGIGDRVRQYIHMPDIALATAQWELNSPGYTKGGYTMLRDQSGGKVSARTLQSVIDEYDGNPPSLFDTACIQCGIGDFIGEEE
jgi:hypothetical protein